MFSFFKKNEISDNLNDDVSFDIELIAYALAYEVAVADGAIADEELARIKFGLENISAKNLRLVPLIYLHSLLALLGSIYFMVRAPKYRPTTKVAMA